MKKTSSVLSVILALLMVLNVTVFAVAGDLTLTSAKVGDTDLEGATIPSGSVITLTFSNNVTDSTVFDANAGKIKVKDSEGAEVESVTVSAGSDKTVITVDLGEIADGGYTLNLGKEISAKNTELTLGTKVTISFTVGNGSGEGEQTLSLISAKVGDTDLEGATIPSGSVITLTFSNNVTDSTVFDANASKIKVKDSEGAEVETVTVSAGSDKTVITVNLGEIADGGYTLNLGKEISAKNTELTLGTKVTVSFTVGNGSGEGDEGEKTISLVSAKVGDTDLANSKIPAGSEITLTFSNNVTDESVLAANITKIKAKAADGSAADATVSAGSDKTVFIVTLGNLAKGNYTLTLGKELKAKNGNTLGEKVEISFSVKGDGSGTGGGNNPLSLVSVKANDADLEGAELEASGKIVITFDRGMTENQAANFEQIGIYDKDGKKVEGVTFSDFTKNGEGNSYTELSYENLPAGEYTLKLGKDLKANNGNTLGEDKTISFTVKGEEKSLLDKIFDFVKSVIDYIIDFVTKVLAFVGITL